MSIERELHVSTLMSFWYNTELTELVFSQIK